MKVRRKATNGTRAPAALGRDAGRVRGGAGWKRWVVYREVPGECAGERETLYLVDGGRWSEQPAGAVALSKEEAHALAVAGRKLGLGTSAAPAPEGDR